jgi:hypothetical protein
MKTIFLSYLSCAIWRHKESRQITVASSDGRHVTALTTETESPRPAVALAIRQVHLVQKKALAFGAHLIHRGDFQALSTFTQSRIANHYHATNSKVDSVIEPARGVSARDAPRNHRSTAGQLTPSRLSTKAILAQRNLSYASVAGIQPCIREGQNSLPHL